MIGDINQAANPSAAKIYYKQFPFTLTYGGNVDRASGSMVGQGAHGFFWSIGTNSTTTARRLYFDGSYVSPEDVSYKSGGFSVHCKIYYSQFPFTLTYGGYVNRMSGSMVSQGTVGGFWSIGADSATGARYLTFYGSGVNPEDGTHKSGGFSVRCEIYLH